jgi:hypothetical protein
LTMALDGKGLGERSRRMPLLCAASAGCKKLQLCGFGSSRADRRSRSLPLAPRDQGVAEQC